VRRLDEIVAHYQKASGPGKSLLLRQLVNISLHFDHARVRTFLDTEASSSEPWIRYIANVGQHTIGPEALAHDFGLQETKERCTSTYYLDHDGRPMAPSPVDQARRLNALASVLAGPIDGLFGLVRDRSPWMSAALSCLGVFSNEHLIDRLVDLSREPEVGPLALLALGISASRRARRAATRALKAISTPDGPTLAVLSYLPHDQHPEWLSGSLKGDDCDLGLAIAAVGHAGDAGSELLGRLLSSPNPWVRAHALHSLALIGGAPALAIGAYNRETAPLLKILCVRALATTPSAEGRDALLSFLRDAPAAIQGEIVEVLTLIDDPESSLPPALADAFLSSNNIQLRSAAIVMLFRQDPERVSASIAEVLSSGDPMVRREGAYCLGHLRHPSSPSPV
jgi:HEAT repeat protein